MWKAATTGLVAGGCEDCPELSHQHFDDRAINRKKLSCCTWQRRGSKGTWTMHRTAGKAEGQAGTGELGGRPQPHQGITQE